MKTIKVVAASLASVVGMTLSASSFALDSVPVRITNTPANPVPVTGTVGVSGTANVNVINTVPVSGAVSVSNTAPIPVAGSVSVTNTAPIPITGTVNVGSLPPITVQATASGPRSFVVPFYTQVTGIDNIAVTLSTPAILDAVAIACDISLYGAHLQMLTDSLTTSSTAFPPLPPGTALTTRDSTTAIFTPQTPLISYPAYGSQTVLDYPNLQASDLNLKQLNQVILSDVRLIGFSYNAYYGVSAHLCRGYFLFNLL